MWTLSTAGQNIVVSQRTLKLKLIFSTIGNTIQTPTLPKVDDLIRRALDEDIQTGDLTTNHIIPESHVSRARWVSKEEGVVAGLFTGKATFEILDAEIQWHQKVEEGDWVQAGDVLAEMEGSSRSLLSGERTALNFVQRMSGIATAARKYVEQLQGTSTQILDTRKTVPGLRALDKYAVRTGGGTNHRMGLYDMALIKENHIAISGGIQQAVGKVRNGAPEVKIEVEASRLAEVEEAVLAGADIIMLDNMSLSEMEQAVVLVDSRVETEASGNVRLDRVKAIGETGVDFISVGALTHSVKAFDISQLIIDQNKL